MDQTPKTRYEELARRRSYCLDVARRCAALTMPTILPPDNWNGTYRSLNQPYQGFGARGVVNLSSRLMMAIMPPGAQSFKLGIPKKTLLAAGQVEEPEEAAQGLAMVEKAVMAEMETRGWRQPTNLTLQLLTVTGNALEYVGQDGRLRVFRLDQYVVSRDASGSVLEIILKQMVSPRTLSPELLALLGDQGITGKTGKAGRGHTASEDIELYTWVRRKGEGYVWEQWLRDVQIPGSEGNGIMSPFIPLRWASVPGEDYGRGKVEEHLPDLETLDHLTKSLVDGAEMAAWHVMGVDPNAANARLKNDLKGLENGDVISMREGDVNMLQFANVPGLQVAQAEVGRLTQELGRAFLMTSGIQRNAERVTATELRMLAEELEGTLGGVFSMLSEEMQRGRVERLIGVMQSNGQIPAWGPEQVEPTITTGLAALGRESEALRVIQAYQALQAIPPEAWVNSIKHEDALKKMMNGFNLPGLVRTEQEAQQRQQEQAMQQMAQQAGMGQTPQ